jgi:hypothetical protein
MELGIHIPTGLGRMYPALLITGCHSSSLKMGKQLGEPYGLDLQREGVWT